MKKLPVDRWIPEKGRPEEDEESPQNHKTPQQRTEARVKSKANGKVSKFSAGGVRLNDEVDNIPIGKLYTPSQKRPRKAAASTSNPGDHSTAAEDQITGPVSVTLSDPDVLDCPICFEPLSSPVFQCENGHIACASCCTTTLKNKCANCSLPTGKFRNRAIENVVESVIVVCQNKQYGCKEVFSYSKKVGHEKACTYVPCSCPFINCNFVGLSKQVYTHFALEHNWYAKQFSFNTTISIVIETTRQHVILRERKGGVLFVLNRCVDTLGSFCNVVCVAPSASEERFVYELTATIGEDSVKVKRSMEMMSKWTPQPLAEMSLLVPTSLISTTQLLKLDLIIRKKFAPAN